MDMGHTWPRDLPVERRLPARSIWPKHWVITRPSRQLGVPAAGQVVGLAILPLMKACTSSTCMDVGGALELYRELCLELFSAVAALGSRRIFILGD
eukprot:587177-Amphidinium_carterae.1